MPIPADDNLPVQQTIPGPGLLLYLSNTGQLLVRNPTRSYPTPLDSKLAPDAPEQKYRDCRTFRGLMDTIQHFISVSWVDSLGAPQVKFTHDFSLLPQDPGDWNQDAIIVFKVLARQPHNWSNTEERREVKPSIRQVLDANGVVIWENTKSGYRIAVQMPTQDGVAWVWGQSFDYEVVFTIFGKNWDAAYQYTDQLEDLFRTYTGIFKQSGAQEIRFLRETSETLNNPQRTQELPQKSLIYYIQLEHQTKTTYKTVEQVLISAGVATSLASSSGSNPQVILTRETGPSQTPILPGSIVGNS